MSGYWPQKTRRGGARAGAGGPRSNKPRCPCGIMTDARAEARRHKCVAPTIADRKERMATVHDTARRLAREEKETELALHNQRIENEWNLRKRESADL